LRRRRRRKGSRLGIVSQGRLHVLRCVDDAFGLGLNVVFDDVKAGAVAMSVAVADAIDHAGLVLYGALRRNTCYLIKCE
jgi:hypothetical protein